MEDTKREMYNIVVLDQTKARLFGVRGVIKRYPKLGYLSVQAVSRWSVAWTILKLKVTRFVLAILLRVHIWHELRNQRKVQPSHTIGQRTREEVREAVRRVKKKDTM